MKDSFLDEAMKALGGREAAVAAEPAPRLDNNTEISRIYDIYDYPVLYHEGQSISFSWMSAIKFGDFVEFKFLQIKPLRGYKKRRKHAPEDMEE